MIEKRKNENLYKIRINDMMKNTKRSSKRKENEQKEYKKWLGLLCAMIGLCVILLSVYYWRIRETANSQHSYLQIEASEEQFQDKTGYTGSP